jgi:hypothetical protein
MKLRKIVNSPSKITDVYWIYSYNPDTHFDAYIPKMNSKIGKWLVFVPVDKIDEVWNTIKHATEDKKLGIASKVSTARPNSNARDENIKVICVYTYNYEDEKDVIRVRDELRNLGIVNKIPYKTDEDTRKGRYSKNYDKNIAKYYL